MLVRHEQPRPARLLRLLDALPSSPEGVTLLLAAGSSLTDASQAGDPPELRAALEQIAGRDGRFSDGCVLFWSPNLAYAVRPPLPPTASRRLAGWDPSPLLDLLGRPYLLGVVLLRRGGFAVGVFDGDVLVASKAGTRFVKNRHRKGGQSQRRFDRIREKQVDELFEKTCSTARERIEPFAPRLDALFLGGDRLTVQAFLHDCPYLTAFGSRLQSRFLPTPEPRHDTLALAYDMIWRSDWTELRPAMESAGETD